MQYTTKNGKRHTKYRFSFLSKRQQLCVVAAVKICLERGVGIQIPTQSGGFIVYRLEPCKSILIAAVLNYKYELLQSGAIELHK